LGLSNPAAEAFAAHVQTEITVAQVQVRRDGDGWQLRHVDDRDCAVTALRKLAPGELRELAQTTESGAFRPLKSAPNLRRGWIFHAADLEKLATALNRLYPGFLADWLLNRPGAAPITDYRAFTERQTGMYRIAQKLSDQDATDAIRACCHPKFCLKQRLWSVEGLATDKPETKSLIPCFEPCAVMLEFARTAARMAQEQSARPSREEAQRRAAELRSGAVAARQDIREADFSVAENPRRIQLELEKIDGWINDGLKQESL
jgi:hypothetical protein